MIEYKRLPQNVVLTIVIILIGCSSVNIKSLRSNIERYIKNGKKVY